MWGPEVTCPYTFDPLEILCPPPLPTLHGQHSGTPGESSKFGSVVTYTCEPDPEPGVTFVLVGEPTLRCIADHQNKGIWNRPVPRCELSVPAVMCQPPQLPRGYISAGQKERYVYNDTVQFACEPSFTLRGSPKARCMVQGSWYPAVPVCEKGGYHLSGRSEGGTGHCPSKNLASACSPFSSMPYAPTDPQWTERRQQQCPVHATNSPAATLASSW